MINHSNNPVVNLIKQRLEAAFAPTHLDIFDDSDAHVGHDGATAGGGHYFVKIRSSHFKGLSRVKQHRLVYAELGDLIPIPIHALGLDTDDVAF